MTEALAQGRKVLWERNDAGFKEELLAELYPRRSGETYEAAKKISDRMPIVRYEDLGVIDGCEVKALWVMHHTKTLARFKADFAKAFAETDALYTESLVSSDVTPEEQSKLLETFRRLNQRFKLLSPGPLTKRQEEDFLKAVAHPNPAEQFFNATDALAREKGLAVATADPQTTRETTAVHQYVNEMVQAAKPKAMLGAGLITGLSLFGIGVQTLRTKLTRRQMLLGTGAAGVGAIASGTSALSLLAERQTKSHDEMRAGSGAFTGFLYNFEDYRDAMGSAGLSQFCRVLAESAKQSGKPRPRVLLLYGAAHQGPINHYNEHPARRKATMQGYQPTFGTVETPSILMHRPVTAGRNAMYSHEHIRIDQY